MTISQNFHCKCIMSSHKAIFQGEDKTPPSISCCKQTPQFNFPMCFSTNPTIFPFFESFKGF